MSTFFIMKLIVRRVYRTSTIVASRNDLELSTGNFRVARSCEVTGGDWAVAGRLLRVTLAFIVARRYPGRPGLVSSDDVVENHVLRRTDRNGQKWQ